MSERIVPADRSTARTPNDTALQTAWMRFHDFDRASIRQNGTNSASASRLSC